MALRPAALLSLLLASPPALASPQAWEVDTSSSRLLVHVYRDGILSPWFYDQHFAPELWSGDGTFDPDNPEAVQLRLTIVADSLRDQQEALPEEDRRKVEKHVRGPRILDGNHFPEILFEADHFEPSSPASFQEGEGEIEGTLIGTLTLHGQTRPLRVPIKGRWTADTLSLDGVVPVWQSDFGIEPYQQAGGWIGVKDKILVDFSVRAHPRD